LTINRQYIPQIYSWSLPATAKMGDIFLKFIFALNLLLSQASGSTIALTSTKTSIKPLLTSDFTLRCGLENVGIPPVGKRNLQDNKIVTATGMNGQDKSSSRFVQHTDEDMQYVTSVIVSRDGVDLGILTEHFPARATSDATGVKVTGQLKSSGTSNEIGYIELTWKHPTLSQIGNYRCEIATLSPEGHSIDFSENLNISAEDISIDDLVSYVHHLNLEKELMAETIANLTKRDQEKNNTIQDLYKENDSAKKEISDLKKALEDHKSELSVFFTAYLTSSQTVGSGNEVVYNSYFSNVGNGYSTSNGIFTAPISGYYKFDVSMLCTSSDAQLVLKVNSVYTIAIISFHQDSYEGASNSLIKKLNKGDKVSVVSMSRTSYLYSGTYYYGNTFSGKLIYTE